MPARKSDPPDFDPGDFRRPGSAERRRREDQLFSDNTEFRLFAPGGWSGGVRGASGIGVVLVGLLVGLTLYIVDRDVKSDGEKFARLFELNGCIATNQERISDNLVALAAYIKATHARERTPTPHYRDLPNGEDRLYFRTIEPCYEKVKMQRQTKKEGG